MPLVKTEKIHKIIDKDFIYNFEVMSGGIYLIEITARANSRWQNLKHLKSIFRRDVLVVEIDGLKFPALQKKSAFFDGEMVWNGNQLKGLAKTEIFVIYLGKGQHNLLFLNKVKPTLENITITKAENEQQIDCLPSTNNPPESGDGRPWLSYAFVNLAVKELNISAKADKKSRDDEDIKLIIDGKIEKNDNKKSHRDWLWCGKILRGQAQEIIKALNFKKGVHIVELWVDVSRRSASAKTGLSPSLKKIEATVFTTGDNGNLNKEEIIRPYTCGGVGCKEDYNRYDAIIAEVVSYWSDAFLKDTDPPDELLDPNLVKAIMYQESRIGFDKKAGVNVMQVGNDGDPSILTLRGDSPEYWIHNGKLVLLKYDAEVNTVKDSINWGVRWLYHKAQGVTNDKKRYWISWREAVKKYGPPKEEYVNSIWSIYKEGVKNNKKLGSFRLWSVVSIILAMSFLNGSSASTLESQIKDQIRSGLNEQLEDIKLEYDQDKKYFLVQIEQESDWWEELKVGNIKNKNINWLKINKPPTEQAILSGRFVNLEGFVDPVVEIYGLTHVGHGFLYIYEIQNNELNLLLKIVAVDSNPDIRWSPDYLKKYGYSNCGEIFFGDKLVSEYKDINKDGNSDLILSGIKNIICKNEYLNNADEITVDSVPISIEISL